MCVRFIYVILLISLLVACGDSSDCESGPLEVMSMGDLGCTNSVNLMKIRTMQEFELIRDQESYDALITGPCSPVINWDENDMVAGNIQLNNGLINLEEKANFNCSTNTLLITILVHLNETEVAQEVFFGFVIPKLDNDQAPFVEVETL